jgi:glycine/D-amino acid oxidase-like deaminating enzyme
MADRLRIAVVGAGAIGLSTAVRAAELGATVTVLDRATPAAGSSGLSAGIFNRQAVDPVDVEIRVRAERFLSTLERDQGLRLARDGYVRVAYHDDHLRAYERSLAVERELGVEDARLLDRAGLQRLVPELRCDDLAGGLYGPSDGHLDGRLLCDALVERGESLGVTHRFRAAVLDAEERAGGGFDLRTEAGPVPCDVVVNAAGAWAPAVGELLGAPAPIVAERHQICVIRPAAPREVTMPTVQLYVPGMQGEALYVRGEGPERLLAGLHSHDVVHGVPSDPDRYRPTVDDAYAETIAGLLLDRLPGLQKPALAGGWAGLYPLSPDGKPQIGPYRSRPPVVAACGGGGVGLTLGLVYGRLAAEWAVLGEPRSVPAAARYLPERPAPAPVAA